MKKIALLLITLLTTFLSQAQDVQSFVNHQLQTYPKSRLLDLYKSCFQDFMGAEHLVSDKQRVRSANSKKRPTVDSWRDRWHVIIGTIDKMQLELPYYQQDKAFIDSILSVGRYAISHSPEYREAYHPHYRIVERGIFERELKPLIEHKYLQNKNNDMDDKKQIEQLYKQMYQAMIAKDIATLNTILAEGSVLIHMTGTKQPKKQYLHEIENGTLNYYSVEDDEISITMNGTTAEMTGRSRVNAAVYGGGRHTWRLQMKSKLAKNDGRWQFVESKASTY